MRTAFPQRIKYRQTTKNSKNVVSCQVLKTGRSAQQVLVKAAKTINVFKSCELKGENMRERERPFAKPQIFCEDLLDSAAPEKA
jgi:hypothetical protein